MQLTYSERSPLKNLFLFVLFNMFASSVLAQGGFDPTQVQVSEFAYSGTGCPPGSVASDLSQDRQAMTLIFDKFGVETLGAESERLERDRKACQLSLKLQTPPGWQFTVFYMDFRGFASLDADTTGIHSTAYKLGTGPMFNLGKFILTGPYIDDYARIEDMAVTAAPWSDCNDRQQRLVINTAVAVRSHNGSIGYMTLDSLDGVIAHSYGIAWRKCGPGGQGEGQQWAAQCKTAIVRKADGVLLKQIIFMAKGADEARATRLARQRVTAKCERLNERNNGNGRRMCSTEPPVCTASHL
jgi:hypothetical protein